MECFKAIYLIQLHRHLLKLLTTPYSGAITFQLIPTCILNILIRSGYFYVVLITSSMTPFYKLYLKCESPLSPLEKRNSTNDADQDVGSTTLDRIDQLFNFSSSEKGIFQRPRGRPYKMALLFIGEH